MKDGWFRFYNEVVNDPKCQRLSDVLFRTWINLLCLASKGDGVVRMDVNDIAFVLRKTPSKVNSEVLKLKESGLIEGDFGQLKPHNWNGRQYKSDVSTGRVKAFRERQRQQGETRSETVPSTVSETDDETQSETHNETFHPVTETAPDSETDSDSETEQIQTQKQSRAESDSRRVASATPVGDPTIDSLETMKLAVAHWNDFARRHRPEKIAEVQVLSDKRKKHLAVRLREAGGIAGWDAALEKIERVPFLLGDNDEGWKVDFDFLLQQSRFIKLMEGGYERGRGNRRKTADDRLNEASRVIAEQGGYGYNPDAEEDPIRRSAGDLELFAK